jgi:hypothetical protein
MRAATPLSLGEYQAVPFAEVWGDTDWRAGVLLSGGDPRGDRPAKSLYPQLFASAEEALHYACRECERQFAPLPDAH